MDLQGKHLIQSMLELLSVSAKSKQGTFEGFVLMSGFQVEHHGVSLGD